MEKMELSEALKANASVLEELFTSLKLFPFMFRGDVNVTSYDETGALDTVNSTSGMLIKFSRSRGCMGRTFGRYLMPSMVRVGSYKNYIMQQELNIELKTQIQITYGLIGNLFNEKFQLVHAWKN